MKRITANCWFLLVSISAIAQLNEYPIATYSPRSSKHQSSSRTQAVTPVNLPFWDDFSASDSAVNEGLWLYGNSVSLNNGLGVRPPSRNVVSFDGADSLGKPYNVNDVLAKGFADRIISQPIRMDLVSSGLLNTVYISFFYQVQGRGEPPDPGDQLIVSMKDLNGVWEDILALENNVAMATDTFYQVVLPITDPKYFHDSFQFRFSNFARLSGPYDSWHVDYVYLNSGRSATDYYYPDRTISTAFTSLFQEYFSMPVKHFLEDPAANLSSPSLTLYNLKLFDVPSGNPHVQPINYTTKATITARTSGTTTTSVVKLDSAFYPGADLAGLSYLNVTLNMVPPVGAFDPLADSIHILLKYGMATKDNVPISSAGDYDPALYSPIDFRYSDSLDANYVLSSYYAYDDGTAEYAAGLNQAGSFLAFLFPMRTTNPDTLAYVDIYFPEFGDNTSQSLQLQIRNGLTDNTLEVVFEQNIVVERKTKNVFSRYFLTKPIPVQGQFYIGWKQLSNSPIPVGLDKNTDNGDRIYYNTNGIWIQNTTVRGTIMVRPGFGKGDGNVITALQQERTARMYPNPTSGTVYVQGNPESLQIYDMAGRRIETETQWLGTETRITFPAALSGLFIVHYSVTGRRVTEKVMVKPE